MGKPQKSSKSDELHAAARSGDLGALQSFLGADPLAVNSRDKHSRTPYPPPLILLSSCFLCSILFYSNFNYDFLNETYSPPIWKWVEPKIENFTCFLLESVPFFCFSRNNWENMRWALEISHAQHHGIVSLTSDAGNRLHLAAWSGQTEVVSYLCNNRADVGAAAMDDMAAIHFAAQKGHLEVVRTLLSSGASVKASTRKGLTPLHYAAQGSNLDLVKYLVRKGANLSLKTKAGKTALDVANNDEIRSYLEECEKKGDLKESDQISSPKQEQNADTEAAEVDHKEQEDKSLKRKAEEDDVKKEASDPKRNKNVLSHLYTDDTQEDAEDY